MDLISGWLELYLFSSARILFSFFPLPLPPLQPACHAKPAAIVRQQASLVDLQQLQNFQNFEQRQWIQQASLVDLQQLQWIQQQASAFVDVQGFFPEGFASLRQMQLKK